MNPDILQILSLCGHSNIGVEVITNGMLLTPDVSEQLLKCASEIHISFGGSTKKTFESIRQGADFEQICLNIKFLNFLKNKNNSAFPKIWLNPILMKRNIHEIPDIIHLAKNLGCDGISCSHLIVSSPELIEESLFFHQEECNASLEKALQISRQNGLEIILPAPFSNAKQENNDQIDPWEICRFLWNHAFLGMDSLTPCTTINKNLEFDGNIITNRFMDIWNNDWYAEMRYRLLTGDPPDVCKKCKDPSVKDVNSPTSYFTDEVLPYVNEYTKQSLPVKKQFMTN